MEDSHKTYYEKRLQLEIEAIEAKIKSLNEEKVALQRQLSKAIRDNSDLSEINRKNSITRVMIERRIMELLSKPGTIMTSKSLYNEVRSVDFDLKENTFRTHLHRMKKKMMIKSAEVNGRWLLDDRAKSSAKATELHAARSKIRTT